MAGSKVTLAELEVRMSGLSAVEKYNTLIQGAGSATEIAAKQFEALDRQQQAVAASASTTTTRLRETDREWKSLERSIPGTTAAMERFTRVSGQADAALAAGRITAEQHAAAVAKLKERYVGAAESAPKLVAANENAAKSTKLAAHEVTNLSYQLQDAAVQLTGGQSPFLVLMQQGPQATGAVGGVGRALALITSPMGLAVTGAAALVGGIALIGIRAASIEGQLRSLSVTTKAFGTEAQTSAEQLRGIAKDLYAGGAGKDEASATAGVLASTRGITAALAREFAKLGSDMAAGLGQSVDGTVKDLAKIATEGYPAIMKLQEAIGFLTPTEVAAIRAMSEHGRQAEALAVTLEALHRRFDGLRKDSMSPAATAMHELGVQFDRLVDAAAGSTITIGVTVALSDGFKAMADFLQNPTLEGFGKIAKVGAYVASPGGTIIGSYIADRLFSEEDATALQRRITEAQSRLDSIMADKSGDPATVTLEIERARNDIAALEKRLDEINKRTAGAKAATAPTAPTDTPANVPAHRSANDISGDTTAWIAQQQKAREYVDAQSHAVDRLSEALKGNAVERAFAAAQMRAEDEIREHHLEGVEAERIRILRRREVMLQMAASYGDELRNLALSAQGNLDLAKAYGISEAAAIRQKAANDAIAAAASNAAVNIKELTEANVRAAAGAAAADLAKQATDLARMAELQLRVAHAVGISGAAQQEAQRQVDVYRATAPAIAAAQAAEAQGNFELAQRLHDLASAYNIASQAKEHADAVTPVQEFPAEFLKSDEAMTTVLEVLE
ncbi:hypothetical protein CRT60_16405 [Azospirillum palustre]|uniref:Bacteriophage tail tape measure N-terminal domain-containing protein n=1 Tax=Azospirillum palustre TaxID=2044885 RepID=A0A2B8BG34_9PROT|nr:phage tail length tape measure family protein [Azospirillum palustre]PGH56503.1 hypothetical protein CRT60_16405 [Azospirillum palustre]